MASMRIALRPNRLPINGCAILPSIPTHTRRHRSFLSTPLSIHGKQVISCSNESSITIYWLTCRGPSGCIYTSELPPNFPNQTGTENGVCSAAPGWKDCSGNPEACTAAQIPVMNQYEKDFQTKMASLGPTLQKAGNGAFIHSCHTHCEAQSSAWNKFMVDILSLSTTLTRALNSQSTEHVGEWKNNSRGGVCLVEWSS